MKQITANLYTVKKSNLDWFVVDRSLTNGCLFADGESKTNLTKADLPEWFVEGILYKTIGYISAKGVKDLRYQPGVGVRLYSEDILYVSFSKQIRKYACHEHYDDYDYFVYGDMIPRYLEAVRKYSPDIDLSSIEKDMAEKEKWFNEGCPKDAYMLLIEDA